MRGRIPAVTVLAALAAAAPAAAQGDPVLPLAQVQPGMQCTGYSVFRGTTVEAFDVEVLDVLGQATTGGSAARILVRVSGERVDATGVGPGFSGSPIYCPGPGGVPANAGAISETIGEYGGRTVLATPIEQIVGTPVDAPVAAAAHAAPRSAREARREAALLARAKPLTGPITVRGLSRPLQRALSRSAARRGIGVLQAPPFPLSVPGPQTLRPGSAMGVGYSSGDLAVGAVGTVAYVDGANVWGFGHGMENAGGRALLLQDAYVSAIIDNPVQSDFGGTYKLAGPVNDVGTLSNDGFNAVAGRTGELPPIIPVRVYTRDEDRDVDEEMLVRVADETDVGNPTGYSGLAFVAPLAVTEAGSQILGAAPLRVAGRMCFQAVVREIAKPLRFCNRYVSDGTFGSGDGFANAVALAAGGDAAGALALFDTYKGSGLHLDEVSARLRLTRGQRMAYLRRVKLPKRVRPGATVPARMVVKVVRGPRRTFRFRWRVPESLRPGSRVLKFRGTEPDGAGDFFGAITISFGDFEAPDPEGPRTKRAIAREFRSYGRWDGVRVRGMRARLYRHPTFRIGGLAQTRVTVARGRG